MSRGRAPNTGPYVVSFQDYRLDGSLFPQQEFEYQLWEAACRAMRLFVVAGHTHVSVRFV